MMHASICLHRQMRDGKDWIGTRLSVRREVERIADRHPVVQVPPGSRDLCDGSVSFSEAEEFAAEAASEFHGLPQPAG